MATRFKKVITNNKLFKVEFIRKTIGDIWGENLENR
jgi:hypothetical protein